LQGLHRLDTQGKEGLSSAQMAMVARLCLRPKLAWEIPAETNGMLRKEGTMSEIPDDVKKMLFEADPKLCCRAHDTMVYLGIAFLLVGIISDAINEVLGLEPTNWFIMSIAFFIVGIFAWFRGYLSAKEK
jgi:hypothetical protein